jgi:hypothetical protein
MAEQMVRVKLSTHFKTRNCSLSQLASFGTMLPRSEATRLLNDMEGRRRLVFLHYPSAISVDDKVAYDILW